MPCPHNTCPSPTIKRASPSEPPPILASGEFTNDYSLVVDRTNTVVVLVSHYKHYTYDLFRK
jgi:hypothetical protein